MLFDVREIRGDLIVKYNLDLRLTIDYTDLLSEKNQDVIMLAFGADRLTVHNEYAQFIVDKIEKSIKDIPCVSLDGVGLSPDGNDIITGDNVEIDEDEIRVGLYSENIKPLIDKFDSDVLSIVSSGDMDYIESVVVKDDEFGKFVPDLLQEIATDVQLIVRNELKLNYLIRYYANDGQIKEIGG
ncbi:TPA: hypothetical protein ACGO1T_001592 [Streptococcus suis]